jgi:hypothetical protein
MTAINAIRIIFFIGAVDWKTHWLRPRGAGHGLDTSPADSADKPDGFDFTEKMLLA